MHSRRMSVMLQRGRIAILLITASMAGVTTRPLRAQSPSPTPTTAKVPARQTHLALRELDRFLDHHPLLEDDLRVSPQLAANPDYLRNNPVLRDFLVANPAVAPALALEPRHFLHRALILQASQPLRWPETMLLDPLLDHDPALEQDLARHPELIHSEKFLSAHIALRDLLANHSSLRRAFLAAKD